MILPSNATIKIIKMPVQDWKNGKLREVGNGGHESECIKWRKQEMELKKL
jgi:hypothetical protein